MSPLVFDKFVWSSGIFLVHGDMFSLFDEATYAVMIDTISSVLLVNVVGMYIVNPSRVYHQLLHFSKGYVMD